MATARASVKGGTAAHKLVRVKVWDHGYDDLVKRLGSKPGIVTVGIHAEDGDKIHPEKESEGEGEAKSRAPLTVAQIGSFHEFGLGVPRRSFISDWVDENAERNHAILKKIATAVIDGRLKSQHQGLSQFGELCVGEIIRRIQGGISPALAESTVKAKGSSTPLIDQGTLWQSIHYKVSIPKGGLAKRRKETKAMRAFKRAAKRIAKKAGRKTVRLAKKAGKKTARITKRTARKATRLTKRTGRSTKRFAKRTVRFTKRTAKQASRSLGLTRTRRRKK